MSVLDYPPTTPSDVLIWEKDKLTICDCGHFYVNPGIRHVWYWQTHSKDGCTLQLPDLVCWCGLKRSEHITGHKR